MLSLTDNRRYYFYGGYTDMRKSFDGLCSLITQHLGNNPLSGDVYIFINKNRDRIKLLLWDKNGFIIYYKRLESGTYELPKLEAHLRQIELRRDELLLLLEGISLQSIKRRKRFSLQTTK